MKSVSTPDLRVVPMKGWLTGGDDPEDGSYEIGINGESYALVTLDQVAEIFYRVKDAWFTGGTIGSGDNVIQLSGYDPTPELVYSGDGDNPAWARDWYTVQDVPASMDTYFGEAYDPAFSGVSPIQYVREVVSEYGMWTPDMRISIPDPTPSPDWFADSALLGAATIGSTNGCGLTHYVWATTASLTAPPTSYGLYETRTSAPDPPTYWPIAVIVEFFEEVYFTGESLFDPDGELYVKVDFQLWGEAGSEPLQIIRSFILSEADTQCDFNFVIQLSDSTVTMPLYAEIAEWIDGTDFVLSAKEWFPSAKNSPAVPVFNTNTGEKL